MAFKIPFLSLLLLQLSTLALSATYSQSESIAGNGFLNNFVNEAIADPTHGRVQVLLP